VLHFTKTNIGKFIYHLAIFSQIWLEISIGKENSDMWGKMGFKCEKIKGPPFGSNKGGKGVTFCEFKKKSSSHELAVQIL